MAEKEQFLYGASFCDTCQKTHYYRSSAATGSADGEPLKCPECDTELAQKRAACGYHFLGSKEGDRGEWTCDLDDRVINDIDELLGAVGRIA